MINSKQFQLFRKPSDDSDKSFHIDSHLLNNSNRKKKIEIISTCESIGDNSFDNSEDLQLYSFLNEIYSESEKGQFSNFNNQKKDRYTEFEKMNFKIKINKNKKTEVFSILEKLCKNWLLNNSCFYKDTCSFAHGDKELKRKTVSGKYKTKLCKSFQERSYCNYGNRCQYSHVISLYYYKLTRSNRCIKYNYLIKQFSYLFLLELENIQKDLMNSLSIIHYRKKYHVERLKIFREITGDKDIF